MAEKKAPKSPRFKIELTEEMIENAIPRDSSHCMFAEAVKAARPGLTRVSVDLQTMRFTDLTKGLRYTYLTPRAVQIALVNWDRGVRPEPFAVQLRGAQVTAAGNARSPARDSTPAQKAAQQKAAKAARAQKEKLRQVKLVRRGNPSQVPDRIGGTPPPVSAGRRRAFGLRALEL